MKSFSNLVNVAYVVKVRPIVITCTGWAKNGTKFLYINNFVKYEPILKFFHRRNQKKICSNTVTKDPTTPQVCRCTT